MRPWLFVSILVLQYSAKAQPAFQDSVGRERLKLQTNNSWVLAAWAGANIVQGTISAGNANGSDRAFHQMNTYWNTVNLGIAGLGLWAARKQLRKPITAETNWREQQKIEKWLLLNTGLDAAYIATGLYLKERGNRLGQDQPTGYGNSLLLQGGFLLVFDIIQYIENRRNGKILEKNRTDWQFGPSGTGIGLVYRF